MDKRTGLADIEDGEKSHLKILLVSEYFPPKIFGGGEISAWLLAKNLAKEKGIEVSILTSYFPQLKKFEVEDGVKIYRKLKTGKNPKSFFSNLRRAFLFPHSTKEELIKLNKEENFDIIHCMNTTSMLGASKVKSIIKKPIIAHINSLSLFCPIGTLLRGETPCNEKCSLLKFSKCFLKSGNISKVEKKGYLQYNPIFILYVYFRFKRRKNTLKKMDFFIAISNFMKHLLLREGISEEKIVVVPNLVNLEKFLSLESKEQYKIPKILYLGSYEKFKGPQILLEALRDLTGKFKCNFYGSGSLKKELKEFVEKSSLERRVKINDEVPYPEIPKLYQEHDLIVFPSIWPEPFGRVAIEAMAAGKAIIASRTGGIVDIIEDKENGFLFQSGNEKELRNLIEVLLKDQNLRSKFEKRSKVLVKKYSEEKLSDKLVKIYEKIKKNST